VPLNADGGLVDLGLHLMLLLCDLQHPRGHHCLILSHVPFQGLLVLLKLQQEFFLLVDFFDLLVQQGVAHPECLCTDKGMLRIRIVELEGRIVGIASSCAALGLIEELVRHSDSVRLWHKLEGTLQATLMLEGMLRVLLEHRRGLVKWEGL